MKAERRHELQTNSLALWLRWRAPELWQKYGTWFLLGLITLLLAIVLIRWKLNQPILAEQQASFHLHSAQRRIDALSRLGPAGQDHDIRKDITFAMEASSEPHVQAMAYALLGDYYWASATMPALDEKPPGQATAADLLKQAADAYNRVLTINAPRQPDLLARAHFGIGAIAEERAFESVRIQTPGAADEHWATARKHYQAVEQDQQLPEIFRILAKHRLAMLEELQQPLYLQPATLPTQPSTRPDWPLEFGPMAPPTTGPATRESPATRGAVSPTTAPSR